MEQAGKLDHAYSIFQALKHTSSVACNPYLPNLFSKIQEKTHGLNCYSKLLSCKKNISAHQSNKPESRETDNVNKARSFHQLDKN